ncbi:hypothetical protein Bbelb_098150 [Branchiostoma belcheri]|nr:hypothetical protein Bbelb_098150 [Branchiostoma belcheri]
MAKDTTSSQECKESNHQHLDLPCRPFVGQTNPGGRVDHLPLVRHSNKHGGVLNTVLVFWIRVEYEEKLPEKVSGSDYNRGREWTWRGEAKRKHVKPGPTSTQKSCLRHAGLLSGSDYNRGREWTWRGEAKRKHVKPAWLTAPWTIQKSCLSRVLDKAQFWIRVEGREWTWRGEAKRKHVNPAWPSAPPGLSRKVA